MRRQQRLRNMTRVMAGAVIAALLAAYGVSMGSGASPSPDDPVSAAASSSPNDDGQSYERRDPEEGLVDVYARPFDDHKKRARKVVLFYVSGVDECYGLDHIKVKERRRRVVLTIFEGRHPEAETCPEIGVYVKSIAELERPLGNRKVVDGSQ